MNLRLAAPAILLASLLLLPFLNKPFTIDDPLYLRAAQHALIDPAHPADFLQVWNAGDRLKLSQYMVGSPLPAYLLAAVAALGSREWVAHLYQWVFLCVFILASVAVARRLGCDQRQAGSVGLLVACNPVTLAMSATSMPDLMAATFGALGIERTLAFREDHRIGAGIIAAACLAASVLCRGSALLLLAVAGLMLFPASWKRAVLSLWLVVVAGVVVAVVLGANRGPLASSVQSLTGLRNVPRNAIAYFAFQALTGPLLLYWILSHGRRALITVVVLVALGGGLSLLPSEALRLHAMGAAFALCFLIAFTELARQLRHSTPLLLWVLSGLVVLPYVYLSPKYLLPAVPAAALLVVLHAARVQQKRFPMTMAVLIALGWISGAMIIVGDTTLARSQRAAAEHEVSRAVQSGETIWAAGQWAFLEYAQRAGARALANQPPYPQTGDLILVSRLSYYGKLDQFPIHRELLYSRNDRRCGVFVLNRPLHAGFFSNRFGYLPFSIGCGEVDRYDLYRVLDTLKN